MRPLACWYCRFESRRGHRYLSLVSAVCCNVEVSASADHSSRGGALPSLACLTECNRGMLIMRSTWPSKGCYVMGGKKHYFVIFRPSLDIMT